MEQHKAFLRRLMKGCLLSRKVVVLRALLGLKELALRFVKLSDEHAALKWEALEEEAEQRCLAGGMGEWAGWRSARAGWEIASKCLRASTLVLESCCFWFVEFAFWWWLKGGLNCEIVLFTPACLPGLCRAQGGGAARAAAAQGHPGPQRAGAPAQSAPLRQQHQVRA